MAEAIASRIYSDDPDEYQLGARFRAGDDVGRSGLGNRGAVCVGVGYDYNTINSKMSNVRGTIGFEFGKRP